ncbi:hypothetical protein [Nocardioides terrisoli]|uniref:hypothetical protein n=1 Tax=Nocardioides terrisoli TaxID=3388267 RepID=UPI00287B7EAA|nr:hypothetical protein [Nocardioides marmorisolisilvae]
MRLLVRAGTREVGGRPAREFLVGGPDTPGREAWLWDLSFVSPATTCDAAEVGLLTVDFDDVPERVCLRFNERMLTAELATTRVPPHEPLILRRQVSELVVIVPRDGGVVEDARMVEAGDTLVVEGPDPAQIRLAVTGDTPATMLIGWLRRRDGKPVRWMP